MTNNDELAQKLKNQHIPAKYYLAECRECGELMPSNRLKVLTSPDGASECYCPHCQYGEINDLGIGDEPGALAWNFQQLRIEALLAERDADKKRIADMQEQLARYSMSPGEADQRRCESRVVRDALGYCMDSQNVAPVDLYVKIEEMRCRIAELEARTVSVKLRNPGVIKSPMGVQCEVWERAEVESALYDAGIKLEVGE